MNDISLHLGWIDWSIIIGYMLFSLGLGLYYARRGSSDPNEYFVAGRKLGWFLAGTSIVATFFASDTPLAVSRITRTVGFQGNWFWWNFGIAIFVCMFFFAPLWHRSRLLTDTELIELRYGGPPARILRSLLAFVKSIVMNGITMGWVILAMSKIVSEAFGWSKEVSIPILLITALVYTTLSGMWGLVMTDLFQLILALLGSYALMFFVLAHFGGPTELTHQVIQTAQQMHSIAPASSPIADPDQVMRFFPSLDAGSIAIYTLMFYMLFHWWHSAEGQGYIAQRLFATKNEKHAVLSMLWFIFCHLVVRTWPWIVVGLASIVIFPNLPDPESAYPKMMVRFLPVGMKGIMVASLMAAFMSTISTHLNWGASYLLNDFYRRYFKPKASDRHYVLVSQFFVLLMALLGSYMAWKMNSIFGGWVIISELLAGSIVACLLRWYWWRVNAWSEIVGMLSSIITTLTLRHMAAVGGWVSGLGLTGLGEWISAQDYLGTQEYYFARFSLIILIGTASWLTVTMLTSPVPMEKLSEFYRRVQPGGWWGPVAAQNTDLTPQTLAGKWQIIGCLTGVFSLFSLMFGVGLLCIGQYLKGAGLLVIGSILGALLIHIMLNKLFTDHHEDQEEDEAAASGQSPALGASTNS